MKMFHFENGGAWDNQNYIVVAEDENSARNMVFKWWIGEYAPEEKERIVEFRKFLDEASVTVHDLGQVISITESFD